MRWAGELDFFQEVAETTGEILPAVERMPELYSDLADYVGAFHLLSAGRPSGFSGAEPIPSTEILAYQREFMPDEEPQRFLYLIRRMDQAYLTAIAEKQPQQSKANGR